MTTTNAKPALTEVVCIVDRSGSMELIRDDAIGGFNAFLAAQKDLPGLALLTLALFDHEYEIVHDGCALKDVPALNTNTFAPRGMTALFDAVGRTLNTVEQRISRAPTTQKPDKVIVVILTDGDENSSEEFDKQDIKRIITRLSNDFAWEFVFLAANQDAFTAASGIGIDQAVNFAASAAGVHFATRTVNTMLTSVRRGGSFTGVEDDELN